jgi:hypothetical protein
MLCAHIPNIIADCPCIAYVNGNKNDIQLNHGDCNIEGKVPPPKAILSTMYKIIIINEKLLSLKLYHIP